MSYDDFQSNPQKFCMKCGNELSPENKFCNKCGTPILNNNSSEINEPQIPTQPTNNLIPTKRRINKKIFIPLIVICSLILVLTILFSTHIICISHDWKKATCTSPKVCKYCSLEDGEERGHSWTNATCTKPKTCKRCGDTKGILLDHTKGNWKVEIEPTLVSEGKETQTCTVCDEILDTRSIDVKLPEVDGDSFNFNAEELIDWISDMSTLKLNYQKTDSVNSTYTITMENGTTGALILNHGDNGKDGNVCAIMMYFENNINSMALITHIGEKINSNFSADDAVMNLYYDISYTKADMTVMLLDLDDDFAVVALAPSEFYENILS